MSNSDRRTPTRAGKLSRTQKPSNAPQSEPRADGTPGIRQEKPLKQKVREALEAVLADARAPAAARVSAAARLWEMFGEEKQGVRTADALTAEELDDEIARLGKSG